MATKKTQPKKEAQDGPPSDPMRGQCTFTEEEIRGIEDFYNYCFSLVTKTGLDGFQARKHLEKFHPMAEHIRKCRGYIFDMSKSQTVTKDGKVQTMSS